MRNYLGITMKRLVNALILFTILGGCKADSGHDAGMVDGFDDVSLILCPLRL